MAVERLTDYTRRIWTALGPDDPAGHDIHVNDVIYYMDSSKCCIVTNVYPDGSIDNETLPDVGGGGGGSILTELASGTYTLTSNTSSPVHIPVSMTGTLIYAAFLCVDDPTVAMTRCGVHNNTKPIDDVHDYSIQNLSNVRYHDANGSLKSAAYTQSAGVGSPCVLPDAYVNTTDLQIRAFGSGHPLRAGDISWKIWGYSA